MPESTVAAVRAGGYFHTYSVVGLVAVVGVLFVTVAFAAGRGKDDAVFCGDIMHSPLQTRYPELLFKFDVDPALAAKTRRDFMERHCDTDTLCCTAHFPSPSTGKIRRRGNGFSCEAAS